ncbi:unnamed protein product [Arabis nemorensis]|uniref:Uncharacterized protein n=1 Tax=Arabis nemorensis TaxID=586526 RepID=A0A565C4T6_9BRAS|nr:unnamed protein product [Arabis nemorensis]
MVSQAIPKRSNLVLSIMGCKKVQSSKDIGLLSLHQQLFLGDVPYQGATLVAATYMVAPTWFLKNNMAPRQAVGLYNSKHTLPTARLHHLMVTTMELNHMPLVQLTSGKVFSQLLLLMISLVHSKLQQLDMAGKYLQLLASPPLLLARKRPQYSRVELRRRLAYA